MFFGAAVSAQIVPKSLQEPTQDAAIREAKNRWTVGIVGGLASGTYMRFAEELARALDDRDNLRILPIVSYGAASNLEDLLYLRGVDIAITQSDVFEYFRTERHIPNLNKRINYIIRLPISELHILARNEIKTIQDLQGKRVNLGPEGSASSLTGAIVFQRLGIKIKQENMNNPTAAAKLKSGEISALIRVVGKPVDALARIPPDSGFHLLTVPYSKSFSDYYTLGQFSHDDYPNLVPEGQTIDTVAVPAVLAVYDWARGGDRYRRVERFVQRLFENWGKFQQAPFHPKWRDINLAATVPGWTRFEPADEMLQKLAKAAPGDANALKKDFDAFLNKTGPRTMSSQAERDALFEQFMTWRKSHAANDR